MQDLYKILPFIVGAAISPVLLVTSLLILSQPKRPVSKTIAYLVGSAVTITAITFVVLYIATIRSVPSGSKEVIPHIIIGLLLILLAINIYRRGPTKPHKNTKHSNKKGLIGYLILGVVLMVTNVTTIAMVFAIAVEIRSGDVSGISKMFYFIATIFASLLPILLPLTVLALAGKHSAAILKSLSGFMKQYAHIITAIFFGLLGLFSLLKPFI